MFPILTLIAASALAACPVTFEFHGQPECVEVIYLGGTTALTNDCSVPILVDESVRLRSETRAPGPFVAPQSTVQLRDLSAFTLGMNGEIFGVVASIVAAPISCDEAELDTDVQAPTGDTATPQAR